MARPILGAEVGFFEGVEHVFLVVFGDVEDEWTKAFVAVGSILFPHVGTSDGDYYACACFADFDGRGIYGGDECFLRSWHEGEWRAFQLEGHGDVFVEVVLLNGLLI